MIPTLTSFIGQWWVLGGIAGCCTIVGWIILRSLPSQVCRRFTVENAGLSAFLGTGAITLVLGWCSYLGLPIQYAIFVVLILVIILALRNFVRTPSKPEHSISFSRRGLHWFGPAMIGIIVLRSFLALEVFLIGGVFPYYNDTFFYTTMADMLREYGYYSTVPIDLLTPQCSHWVGAHLVDHRMGTVFFLAGVQSVAEEKLSILVCYPVIIWGSCLNVIGVMLLARWVFRLSRPRTAMGLLLIVSLCDSLHFSTLAGFYSQVFGTGFFAASLAWMYRINSRKHLNPSSGLVAALLMASVISHYHEFAPILFIPAVATVFAIMRKQSIPRRIRIRFLVGVGIMFVVLLNIELWRAIRSLQVMMKLDHVGLPLSWNNTDYFAFALGSDVAFSTEPFSPTYALLIGLSACFLLGVGALWKLRSPTILLTSLATLIGLAIWTWYSAHRPSSSPFATWQIAKVAKWSFPIIATLEVVGIGTLVHAFRLFRWVYIPCIIVVISFSASRWHFHNKTWSDSAIASWCSKTDHPLQEWKLIRDKVDALAPSNIFYFQRKGDLDLAAHYALKHHRFVPYRDDIIHFPVRLTAEFYTEHINPDTLFLMKGPLPWGGGNVEHLGLDIGVIRPRFPVVLETTRGESYEKLENPPVVPLRRIPLKMVVYVPSDGKWMLTLPLLLSSNISDSPPWTITVDVQGANSAQILSRRVDVSNTHNWQIPIQLSKGLNTVLLSCARENHPQISSSPAIISAWSPRWELPPDQLWESEHRKWTAHPPVRLSFQSGFHPREENPEMTADWLWTRGSQDVGLMLDNFSSQPQRIRLQGRLRSLAGEAHSLHFESTLLTTSFVIRPGTASEFDHVLTVPPGRTSIQCRWDGPTIIPGLDPRSLGVMFEGWKISAASVER